MPGLAGPEDRLGPGLHRLATGAWLTSGRAVVLEGDDHLALVDPGDEPAGSSQEPAGPLADLRRLEASTGKRLRWILITHSHPDHVGNLGLFRAARPGVGAVVHARSPLASVGGAWPVDRPTRLELGGGVEVLPTPGHSPAGDDLSFWRPEGRLLLTGDVVQPKGETWEEAFYPSPWPHFTEAGPYLASLEVLESLPFEILVTGHREVRRGAAGRAWVGLTGRAIRRVGEEVAGWAGPDDLDTAGPAIFRRLARERGIPAEAVERRLAGSPSPFERFDLPGVAHFWARRRPCSAPGL